MSICPGCGRCRQCGQPAPAQPYPWFGPYITHVEVNQPIWTQPTQFGAPNTTGTPLPQQPYTTFCQNTGGVI